MLKGHTMVGILVFFLCLQALRGEATLQGNKGNIRDIDLDTVIVILLFL